MIPRIIHQVFVQSDSFPRIPTGWEHARQAVLEHHPGYRHVLWTGEDMDRFMQTNYPSFYRTFKSYKYLIQQIDAFRYFVLYHYGGIYLDLDIGTKRPMDRYLNHDLVLVKSMNVSSSYTNALMMVSVRNPFMKQCMSALELHSHSYELVGKHLHVMHSTGPMFLTKQESKYAGPVFTLSSSDFVKDCNVCNISTCTGGDGFFHVKGTSWNSWDSVVYNTLLCNWKQLLLITGLLLTKNYRLLISIILVWIILYSRSKNHHKLGSEKILVLGSAPYMKEWVRDHLDWFVKRGYHIVACNNAWSLVPLQVLDEWHVSSNFQRGTGTFIPTAAEKRRMKHIKVYNIIDSYLHRFMKQKNYSDYYNNYKGGTMFLNIIYNYLHNFDRFEMVVVGFDMVYKKDGDALYSSPKSRNDPLLKWGRVKLNEELQNSWYQFKKHGIRISNASKEETNLPYPRFTEHLRNKKI